MAFVALAPLVGADPAIAAGAVISGAYFGDKMTPVSETTVLVPSMVGGVTTNEHIGAMIWTSGPAVVIALVLFTILGLATPATGPGFDPASAQATLAGEFSICLHQPAAAGPARRPLDPAHPAVPGDLQLRAVRGRAGVVHAAGARGGVRRRARPGPVLAGIEAIYAAMANGFVSTTGNETIDALFSRGGMAGMLTTIWLILGALSYAAIMEEAGLPRSARSGRSWPAPSRPGASSRRSSATCIGLNIIAGDQYVAIVMPSRVYRAEFARRGIAPRMLSRAVEDSGTVTSPLVPWNSCGAYMAGALGVATIAYLPYCFFNLASPIISLLYGFTGLQDRARPADRRAARRRSTGHPSDGDPAPGGRTRMTAPRRTPRRRAGGRRGFALPSAYTILFLLIVIVALADLDHPGRRVRRRCGRRSRSRAPTTRSPANPQRIVVDSLMAPDQRAVRHRGRGRQHQRLELGRAVRRHRRRPVHPRHRRVPRRDDDDRRDPGRDRAASSRGCAGARAWMIPILMSVFALGGTTFGMAEESLAFYALIITVMIAAGYDALVGASILLLGCGIGVLGSTINPFATGIASGFAGVSIEEGIVGRLIILVVGTAIGIVFVMRYAAKVKADPSRSLVVRPEGRERGPLPERDGRVGGQRPP